MRSHIARSGPLWVGLLLLPLLLSCSTVPLTGRTQLNIIPAGEMHAMSFQQYDEFLKSHPLSQNRGQTEMVKRCGRRIQAAVETYFRDQGQANHLRDYAWEFNLVESPEVNAWCMPGGKVVFYTGILPITRDETGLAVVMGHEIAHAVANHGGERMTQGLLAQMGGMALSKALEQKPEQTRNLWLGAFGLGAQVGLLLPYSRTHENEADHMGLIFMALAGYDPRSAPAFWKRMAAKKGGAAPPEFLSTHPSDKSRIANLHALVPEAMEYYQP